ncbi:heavy metal-associated isoprenylated plant protein 7 isoform X2 [Lathyrus oleraceus]|uniref:heavy metal-associated isoprenylated plant protein 7 isoform X2 n=1 Tax=Pisum sativum TaxID=3888 RepID=UPI0021D218BC|nr:heavy metal-associated isoprenylated plant protein 7-like isoform X2 [Pisum sativum]
MGEEEKKTEETKTEEEETKAEETKDEEAAAPPPPPAEILLKVFMHCEGCARKVRRCLKNFPGVEGVTTNCKTHEVVVKGEKADPAKVVERIQTKSRRKVELVSPLPNPPEEEKVVEEEEKPEPEEEKKEVPQIVTVVLKVHMHCEGCAEEIKKRILKMKGVESVETDLKKSEVTVKGVYDPTMLVKFVYKRFGKQAVIVNEEKVEEEAKAEEEKKEETNEEVEEKKEEEQNEAKPQENPEGAIVVQETKVEDEMKKNESYYNPPMDLYAQPPPMDYHAYPPIAYPACPPYYQTYLPPAPQIFSDENPNACSVM